MSQSPVDRYSISSLADDFEQLDLEDQGLEPATERSARPVRTHPIGKLLRDVELVVRARRSSTAGPRSSRRSRWLSEELGGFAPDRRRHRTSLRTEWCRGNAPAPRWSLIGLSPSPSVITSYWRPLSVSTDLGALAVTREEGDCARGDVRFSHSVRSIPISSSPIAASPACISSSLNTADHHRRCPRERLP